MRCALHHLYLNLDAAYCAHSAFKLFRVRPCPPLPRAGRRRAYAAVACYSASSAPSTSPSSAQVPPPLHERPAVHAAAAAELAEWRAAALVAAEHAAVKWREPDDPSFQELQQELRWLLEDAVEGYQPFLSSPAGEESQARLRLPLTELRELWHRRLHSREPLQYLTGAAHWRDLILAVGPGALIPRPETEQLLEFALEAVQQDPGLAAGAWADLGTGSGALAVGLATASPQISQIWAVDSSPAACAWAAYNARRLAVADRVQVRQGSWLEPLAPLRGRLAGILSNPPYIEREVLPRLQATFLHLLAGAEVRLHEPAAALDGGAGAGLDCLRHICSQAALFLRPGGLLALETGGPHQTQPVAELLAAEFTSVERRKDIFGVERFVTARLRQSLAASSSPVII